MHIILRANIPAIFAEYLTTREQPELMSAALLDNLLQIVGQQVEDFCVKVLSHPGRFIAAFVGPVLMGASLERISLKAKRTSFSLYVLIPATAILIFSPFLSVIEIISPTLKSSAALPLSQKAAISFQVISLITVCVNVGIMISSFMRTRIVSILGMGF